MNSMGKTEKNRKQQKTAKFTSICQTGMKSALCLTLSNILWISGLIKLLSTKQNECLVTLIWSLTVALWLLFAAVQAHEPDMLSICPSLSAAPLTLHRVLTILSAFASVRNGLLSKMATPSLAEIEQMDKMQMVTFLFLRLKFI